METLMKLLGEAETVAILGHVHPDGDCVGSCLGMYNYLADNFGKLSVRVFLEPVSEKFSYLRYFDRIENDLPESLEVDLCISLDASDRERLGAYDAIFSRAKKTFCIDHHITNPGFAQENHVVPGASSACEVLFGLLDETKIGRETAECLYTGIVHDTGVFKHNNTTGKTMAIAGRLLDKGLDGERIIDDSFFKKSYVQNQILGRALLESITFLDGKCIFSALRQSEMEFYGVNGKDMDGIIDQLRLTEGVEVAIFMYQTGPQEFKVSLRSQNAVDVSRIASYFGGGGHVRAAGCTMSGRIHDVVNNLSLHIAKQLDAAGPQEE